MTKIQLRHDTAANFASENPILLAGEAAIETDTNKFKIGDGATAWNDLVYQGGDFSDYYNKVETDELLGKKQDSFEAQAPIIISNGIGKIYTSAGTEYEGTIVNQSLYLFQYPSQNSIPGVDTTDKSWELRYDNVFIKEATQSFISIMTVYPGVNADRSVSIFFSTNDNLLHAESTLTGSLASATATIAYGEYYDFRITHNGNNTTLVQYKLSSDINWITILTSSMDLSKRGFKVELRVSGNSSIIGDLKGVTFTNDGIILFERTIDELGLSIGSGLAIQDGNLVNTNPTPVDVSTKVTGDGVSTIKALTQAEYDALATKDANTFYVIVEASSS